MSDQWDEGNAGLEEAPARFQAAGSDHSRLADFPSAFEDIAMAAANDAAGGNIDYLLNRLRATSAIASLSAEDPFRCGLPISGVIGGNGAAAAICDAAGHVISISEAAADILGKSAGDELVPREALDALTSELASNGGGCVNVSDASGRPHLARAGYMGDQPAPGITAFFFQSIRLPQNLRRHLGRIYDLSGAELDVMELTLRRHSINEIAARRDRSVDTIRTQHNKIIKKFAASSIMDAALTVSEGILTDTAPAISLHDVRAQPGSEYSQKEFALRDKRGTITCFRAGPVEGRTLLYIHPTEFPGPPPGAFARAAIRQGMRIIAPLCSTGAARQGGIASTPAAEASDIADIARQLGIEGGIIIAPASASPVGAELLGLSSAFNACVHIVGDPHESPLVTGVRALLKAASAMGVTGEIIRAVNLWLRASGTDIVYRHLWDAHKPPLSLHTDAEIATKFAIATLLNADELELTAQLSQEANGPGTQRASIVTRDGNVTCEDAPFLRPATLFDAPADLIAPIAEI